MYKTLLVIIFTVLFGLFSSCLERYYPEEEQITAGTLVINAHITDKPDAQIIEISRSSTLSYSKFEPVSGCYALLAREDGESRDFFETHAGYYSGDLDGEFLQIGMLYQVRIFTPDGNEYHSDFDKLRPVPPIDSIYWELETMSYQAASNSIEGLRFFIDFTYDDEAYEFIRWELLETYEFHNPDMKAYVYETPRRFYPLPDSSNPKVCYITRQLNDIHSMSTRYLERGSYVKKPFTFVPNDKIEQKLLYKYSLLVQQYSVGPEAFHYWNELKKISQEQGWLFDSQPALLKSNICNINDESEKILGYFSMSCVSEIRGIADRLEGLDHSPYKYYCLPADRGPGGTVPTSYPAYFARAFYNGTSVYNLVNKHCVDCRAYKGSTDKMPDYW